jgi:hypothetical protein
VQPCFGLSRSNDTLFEILRREFPGYMTNCLLLKDFTCSFNYVIVQLIGLIVRLNPRVCLSLCFSIHRTYRQTEIFT